MKIAIVSLHLSPPPYAMILILVQYTTLCFQILAENNIKIYVR